MNNLSSDVLIIGSGPAGCAAAMTCRKAGLKVGILTKENDPASPDASALERIESIHPGVSSLLEKIGAGGIERIAAQATYMGIHSGKNYNALGQDEHGAWKGFHISRSILNQQLLGRTREQGVSIVFNTTAEDLIRENGRITGVKTKSANLYAPYIIDASGKHALTGKKLNLRHKFYSPPLYCWTGVSGGMDHMAFDPHAAHFIPGDQSWTWLAPIPPGLCAWTRLSLNGDKSLAPPAELKDFPILGKVQFANMRWRMFQPAGMEGLVLCGDAAGILDPAAGQGIFNALWSGIFAADTVINALQQPHLEAFHLAKYHDWFVQQFEKKVDMLRNYYTAQGLMALI